MTDDANPQPNDQPPADDSVAEQALRAAREAIAGLGDLASSAADAEPQSAPAASRHTVGATKPTMTGSPVPIAMPAFDANLSPTQAKTIDLLSDVNLNVKIELGRTRLFVEDVLRLGEGAVVELDKLAGDPVDVYVNDRHVARGEVLVLNDNFCVRINEILAPVSDGEKRAG